MAKQEEPFPWHLPIYDAHCHPTDTMSLTPLIPSMKTRILTTMATRSQDQDLVASLADTYGIQSSDPEKWSNEERIVPCFGWHPWFAHQVYISEAEGEGRLEGEEKIAHYAKVFKKKDVSDEDRTLFMKLPDPMPFSLFLSQTRTYLQKHPYALVGEIGLDRGIRVPEPPDPNASNDGAEESLTPGSREGRKLTNLRPDPAHQKEIFIAQMSLAAEMSRPISIHGVQAHGMLFEAIAELWKGHERKVPSKRERKKMAQDQAHQSHPDLEEEPNSGKEVPKPYPPRICLHSYSGDSSNLMRYFAPSIPIDVFVSFSSAINLSDALDGETPAKFSDMVKQIPEEALLVESDLHAAGDEMDRRMEDIVRRICAAKEWGLEDGVRKLGRNWRRFVFGDEK